MKIQKPESRTFLKWTFGKYNSVKSPLIKNLRLEFDLKWDSKQGS